MSRKAILKVVDKISDKVVGKILWFASVFNVVIGCTALVMQKEDSYISFCIGGFGFLVLYISEVIDERTDKK